MSDNSLNYLMVIGIESDNARNLDIDEVVNTFSSMKLIDIFFNIDKNICLAIIWANAFYIILILSPLTLLLFLII